MCVSAPHVASLSPDAIVSPRTGPPSGTPAGGRRVAAGCRAGLSLLSVNDASAQRAAALATGDLIPKWDRLAAGAAFCVISELSLSF